MTWRAYKNKKYFGTVTINPKDISLSGDAADDLRSAVASAIENGVPRLRCVSGEENSRVMFKEAVTKDDPLFPLALKEHLERKGYSMEGLYPELDAELQRRLVVIPDIPSKRKLLEELSDMTYLEKTFLLEVLP